MSARLFADVLVCLAVRSIVGEEWHSVARPLVEHWRSIGRPRGGFLVWDGEDALWADDADMVDGWVALDVPVVAVNVDRALAMLNGSNRLEGTAA